MATDINHLEFLRFGPCEEKIPRRNLFLEMLSVLQRMLAIIHSQRILHLCQVASPSFGPQINAQTLQKSKLLCTTKPTFGFRGTEQGLQTSLVLRAVG